MVTGAVLAFIWEPVGLDVMSGLHPMLAGVMGSTVVMIAVSLATQQIAPVPQHVLTAMDEAARVGPIPKALFSEFK